MSIGAQTRTSRRQIDLRTYLAGGAATSALIVGAAIVFASLAAYVGFNGRPVSAQDDGDTAEVVIAGDRAAEGGRAASAGDGGPRRADARGGGSSEGSAQRSSAGQRPTAQVSPATRATPVSSGSTEVQGLSAPEGGSGQTSTGPAPAPTSTPVPVDGLGGQGSSGGPVEQILQGVEQTTALPVHQVTEGVTGQVRGALDGIGQSLGVNGSGSD